MPQVGDYRFPSDRYYAESSHVWVAPNGDGTAELGIDDFEQEVAGTYQRLMLREPGERIEEGTEFANLESSKFVGSKVSPVSGEVVDVNMSVVEAPQRINRSPYESWLLRVALEDESELDSLVTGEAIEGWIEAEIDREKERTTLLEGDEKGVEERAAEERAAEERAAEERAAEEE